MSASSHLPQTGEHCAFAVASGAFCLSAKHRNTICLHLVMLPAFSGVEGQMLSAGGHARLAGICSG
jgi:hypothetical protein